ncbi:MAG: SMP-30/gluconolactonase/LRE family protein [SAR202 cluster bacterium]|nr:SMP-30/gluconolactonase/LRE family protein [SAR202 cluster bacterium]
MSGFEVYENSFKLILGDDPQLVHHATGFEWTEGPAYFVDGDYLLFSDIPNNKIIKWSDFDGVSVFRESSDFSNGNFVDSKGRLITCQHGTRNITRTENNGTITNIIDNYQGKKLNSPNDLVENSKGDIFFTDPPYGILSDDEGYKAESELKENYVFRFRTDRNILEILSDEFDKPNGLCFSPDEKYLYVTDSGEPGDIKRLELNDDYQVVSSKIFAVIRPGVPDGLRIDSNGNIFTSAWDGIQVLNPLGDLIGKILVPEDRTANCCWGGKLKNRLYITADKSIYSIILNTVGL